VGQVVSRPGSTPAWRRYLRFWGHDPERDLDDELRFHLEARYEEYVAAGMNPAAARSEAERRFGSVDAVRDQCVAIDSQWERRRTMADMFHILVADLRYAVRQLRRNPSLSIAAILCFALGIGANTSIFSVVDAVLLRPLPYRDPGRLAVVFNHGFSAVSPANLLDWKRQAPQTVWLLSEEDGTAVGSARLTPDASRPL